MRHQTQCLAVLLFLLILMAFATASANAQYSQPICTCNAMRTWDGFQWIPYPHVHAQPAIQDISHLPMADEPSSDPLVQKIWHPGHWERVETTYWTTATHPGEWVDAVDQGDGLRRQIWKPPHNVRVQTKGWEVRWKEGYHTYVYPNKYPDKLAG